MAVSSTGTLSSAGLGSGLNVEDIVSKLVTLERQPIDRLQTQKTDLDTQVSSFGKVQSLLSTVRDAARSLTSLTTWKATTSTVSDATVIKATASGGAPVGNYNITVARLAAAQAVTSAAFSSSTAAIGEGTITIAVGQWTDGTPPTFTERTTPAAVPVSIGPGDNTLEKIRDKINGAGAGVTATIVRDVSGARLSIRSSTTGAENGFRLQTSSTSGDLSGLDYDPASGAAGGMTLSQKAQNAQASIDGIAVESASNTLTDVVDGITLQLLKTTPTSKDPVTGVVTSTPVGLAVTQDTDSIKKTVNDFATAYNAAMKYLRDQTAYDATSKKAGPLQGDATAVGLMSQLRSLVSGNTGASGVFTRLTDLGLEPQADGSLSVKGAKLDAALGNMDEMRKAFSTTAADGAPASANGLAKQFQNYLDGLLGADGALGSRTEGLNARIKRNQSQQASLEDRVSAYEDRVRKQYQALDTKMSSLSSLSSYVTQQMSMLNKNA